MPRRRPTKKKAKEPQLAQEAASEDTGERRARAGRRTVEERTQAVTDLLSGKASVEQICRRLGVQAQTVERWRQVALEGIATSMRQGTGRTQRERELERELKTLEKAFTRLAIKHEIAERELGRRPTQPGRSSS